MNIYLVASCIECIVKDLSITYQSTALQFDYDLLGFVGFKINHQCLQGVLSSFDDMGQIDRIAVLWIVHLVELGRYIQTFCSSASKFKFNFLDDVVYFVVAHHVKDPLNRTNDAKVRGVPCPAKDGSVVSAPSCEILIVWPLVPIPCGCDGTFVESRFRTDLDVERKVNVLQSQLTCHRVQLIWVDEARNYEH